MVERTVVESSGLYLKACVHWTSLGHSSDEVVLVAIVVERDEAVKIAVGVVVCANKAPGLNAVL